MGKFNVGPNKNNEDFIDAMSDEMQRIAHPDIYCQVCGKPVIRYGGTDPQTWEWMVENEAHPECARRYKREQEMRRRAEGR